MPQKNRKAMTVTMIPRADMDLEIARFGQGSRRGKIERARQDQVPTERQMLTT